MANKKSKALMMLSLSQKAGALKSGEAMVRESVRARKARLVILARDASEGTKKRFFDKCRSYGIPLKEVPFEKEDLGAALGKAQRSCIAFLQEGLADSFAKTLDEYLNEVENSGEDKSSGYCE